MVCAQLVPSSSTAVPRCWAALLLPHTQPSADSRIQPSPLSSHCPVWPSPPQRSHRLPRPPGPATPVPTAARPMAVEPELLWAALNRRNVRWLSCYLSFGPADPCSVLLSVQSPASTGGLPASVTAHCWVSSDCGAWSLQTPCLWHQQRLPPPHAVAPHTEGTSGLEPGPVFPTAHARRPLSPLCCRLLSCGP